MEELIKQAFLHVDIIGPHVQEGHYDLVGPDGEIILPQIWDTVVQPDWSITMHMWPIAEPPPPPPPPEAPKLPPPPPEIVHVERPHKSRSGKPKKAHVVQVPPPPPMMPGPPPPMIIPVGPSIVTSSAGSSRSKKVAPSPFFRWAAGTTGGRSQSVKRKK